MRERGMDGIRDIKCLHFIFCDLSTVDESIIEEVVNI